MIGDADPLSRTGTLFILGDAQDAVGDVAGAAETFRETYYLGQKHGHQIIAANALSIRGVPDDSFAPVPASTIFTTPPV
jgi:hypothetical protein